MLRVAGLYRMSFTYPCPRKLREVMKMSLIERESEQNIRTIWEQYHSERVTSTCDALDKYKYQHLVLKAKPCPMFLLPIYREGGHFKLLTQWQDNSFLVTYLQTFRREGANAAPILVFTLFSELLFKKGLVLVRGDILNGGLNKSEANLFWKMLESAYIEPDKYELVHTFNNNPQNFDEQKYNRCYGIE